MNKYNIVFVIILSACILETNSQYYMPMTKRTVEFGEEICRYEEYKDQYKSRNLITYVKPCEAGKICKQQGTTNDYNLYACQPLDFEYDNSGKTCQTKDNHIHDLTTHTDYYANGIDCTDESCIKGTCGQFCPVGQVKDPQATEFTCMNDPNFCIEYDSNENPTKSYSPAKNKGCAEIELGGDTNGKNYKKKKLYSNYIASIDDGKFIYSISYMNYCKSGYALFFYGNGNLANPNTDLQPSETMYLRCVTILGIDSNKIIKYTIDNGDEMYYDYDKLPSSYKSQIKSNIVDDEYLMVKVELFKNYKQKMDDLNCRETGCKDEDEITKLKYFYYNPDKYLLYKDEPQVVEYLIKEDGSYISYKAKHTSSNGVNSLNIKYLMALLSLILLF